MNPRLLVLFATQTGNAQSCAAMIAARADAAGIPADTAGMGDFQAENLPRESAVLLVASTWGEGEPPDDALPFFTGLEALPAGALRGVHFAVYALGDRAYEHFCRFGTELDRVFEGRGAARLLPPLLCDVDYNDPLDGWWEGARRELAGRNLFQAVGASRR